MGKFQTCLVGIEFNYIEDWSGIIQWLDQEYEATHIIQRWKMELLRFQFTVLHRPETMLTYRDNLYQ